MHVNILLLFKSSLNVHPGFELLMLIQIARNSKRHLTERTLVWFFTSISALWKVNSRDDLNNF